MASQNAGFSFSPSSRSNTCVGNKTRSYCECVPDGGGAPNKSSLFSLNEKGKEIHFGFVHPAGFVLEQRRVFLSSSVFVYRVISLQQRRGNARCASCVEARILPALPACWSVALGSAKQRELVFWCPIPFSGAWAQSGFSKGRLQNGRVEVLAPGIETLSKGFVV